MGGSHHQQCVYCFGPVLRQNIRLVDVRKAKLLLCHEPRRTEKNKWTRDAFFLSRYIAVSRKLHFLRIPRFLLLPLLGAKSLGLGLGVMVSI